MHSAIHVKMPIFSCYLLVWTEFPPAKLLFFLWIFQLIINIILRDFENAISPRVLNR